MVSPSYSSPILRPPPCVFFLISSASVRSRPFLSFIEPIFALKCSLGIFNFLKEISSVSHSIVFLYFFALITEEGFLISSCYSLGLCIQMGISFLFSFAFRLSSFHSYLEGLLRQPFCFFCISFSWGLCLSLSPIQCHTPLSIVPQALCLSGLFP